MTNRVTPPPMENDPRRDPSNGQPVARGGDARNEGPPYDRTHSAADPGHVRREEDVANDDKRMPSESNLAIILGGVAALLAVLAVILDAADVDLLATILAVSGVVTGVIATLLAWNDARGSPVVPGLCAAAAVVVLIIILMDILGADTKARALRDNAGTTLTAPADGSVREPPANPAAIIDPKLENNAAQPAAPNATPAAQ